MSILDVHTHPLFRAEGCVRETVGAFLNHARAQGITRVVALGDVLAYGRSPTAAQLREINDDTAWLVATFPGQIMGFCYLNPTLGERAVRAEVDRGVALGLRGIKLEIANNARDACMRPVMQAAEEHGLVVLQHAWSMTKIRQRSFHTDPEDAVLLARRYPNVRVIMAHLTGCGVRGVLAARGCDNLWVDTSGAAPEAGLVGYAVEQLGVGKVLYGSDAPIRDYAVALARITDAGLTASEQRRILGQNAKELLNWS
ncbi:MAG TPA: amidohydrolase family protein [Opitutaceae bacterium]|jgi:predicted TIM-barrel fold metal-dependent hydrolase|nr:amidohydrolase family protein [Opitutaceae bacterium]